jgi:F0F1-type ATP synthase membrane subunit c/vacuolar-type H+-ATPase subunit K
MEDQHGTEKGKNDGLMAALLGIGIGLLYSSLNKKHPNQNQGNADNATLVKASKKTATATIWIAIAAVATFAAAIGQAIIFNHQLGVMQRQLDVMERDQMPYVAITGLTGLPEYREGVIWWTYHYTNFGKGRAVSVKIFPYIKVGVGEQFKWEPGKDRKPGFVGDIQQGKDDFGTIKSGPITQDYFNQLIKTDLSISLLLEFEYLTETGETGKSIRRADCLSRIASSSMGILNSEDCEKQKAAR